MAGFFFRLERVLQVRMRQEERLRQAFAVLEERVQSARRELEAARARLEAGEERLRELGTGTIRIDELLAASDRLAALRREFEVGRARLDEAVRARENGLEALLEAMKARQALEALKEKEFARYVREEARREQRETDDIAQRRRR